MRPISAKSAPVCRLLKKRQTSVNWRVYVEYANHTIQDASCYEEYFPGKPEELYAALLEYFQPEENDLCDSEEE